MQKSASWVAISALTFVVGVLLAERPAEAGPPRQWQYRCVEFTKSPSKPANDLGKRGWEMVGQVNYKKGIGQRSTTCFKRLK